MIIIHGLPKRLALGTVVAALVMMPVLPVPFAGLSGAALAEEDGGGKGGGGKGGGEDEGGGEDKAKRGAARAKARAANPSRRRFPLP